MTYTARQDRDGREGFGIWSWMGIEVYLGFLYFDLFFFCLFSIFFYFLFLVYVGLSLAIFYFSFLFFMFL